ncbi:MAG: adenosine kinase [Bacteroidaceae bacterium]|nr:adenosine kinase [Bacteroidaceae bacterium]
MGNALVDVLARIADDATLERLGLPKGSMQLVDADRYTTLSAEAAKMSPSRTTGGSAGNTILAIANLGLPTGFIGRVGDDDNGAFYTANSREHGIRFQNIGGGGTTGVALTFISPDGQRTFGTHLGVAGLLRAEDLKAEMFAGYDFFHVEGYLTQDHALISRAYQLAHEAGLTTCIDLASYNIVEADRAFFAELLPQVDIVFANEEEARAFTGKQPEEALEDLAAICPTAVVKTGARGALAARGAERASVAAHKVSVVDTTAAGDYFAAGFLYATAEGLSLAAALETGTLLASEVVQVVGTRLDEATWEKIRAKISTEAR